MKLSLVHLYTYVSYINIYTCNGLTLVSIYSYTAYHIRSFTIILNVTFGWNTLILSPFVAEITELQVCMSCTLSISKLPFFVANPNDFARALTSKGITVISL